MCRGLQEVQAEKEAKRADKLAKREAKLKAKTNENADPPPAFATTHVGNIPMAVAVSFRGSPCMMPPLANVQLLPHFQRVPVPPGLDACNANAD